MNNSATLEAAMDWRVVLRGGFLIPALMIATLMTWGVDTWMLNRASAQFKVNAAKDADVLSDGKQKTIALGAISTIAGDVIIQKTARGLLPPDNPQTIALLKRVFDTFNLLSIMLLNRDGTVTAFVIAPGKPHVTGKNYSFRPYFTGALAGRDTMYAAFGKTSGERGFYVSVPVRGETADDVPIGVLMANVGFENVDSVIASINTPTAILSPEQVIFASNVPEWTYRVIGDTSHVAAALREKRVNPIYEKTPPLLLPMDSQGNIEWQGRKQTLVSVPIGWSDPTGTWRLAEIVDTESTFGLPAQLGVWLLTFFILMQTNAWWLASQRAKQKTRQVVNLLDNSGQGFLSFGADGVIDSEYSLACETMLGGSPAGKGAADALFGAKSKEAALFREVLPSALDEQDGDVQSSILSLLPKDIRRNESLLKIEYKVIGRQRVMVVLTDATAEFHMEEALSKEQSRLKLIVLAIADNRNFFEAVDAFREFLDKRLDQIAKSGEPPRNIAKELFREIHTFKGILNQFSFPATPRVLHEAESRLGELTSSENEIPLAEILGCVAGDSLHEAIAADLTVLTSALGEDFLSQGRSLLLTEDQAKQLERLANRLLRGEPVIAGEEDLRELLQDIVRLRKIRFSEALKGFDRLVQQVAQRTEKEVAPLEIRGEQDIWIDPQHYKHFLHALVHIFRNAVAHGIESPEARWEAEKETTGLISCTVSRLDNAISLSIADDGAGLNLEALRAKAVTTANMSQKEADAAPDEVIARTIFLDGVSTQHDVSDIAGRGVGLAAVLSETEKIGGRVDVRTMPGQGTEFVFVLPVGTGSCEASTPSPIPPEFHKVMESVVRHLGAYFESECDLPTVALPAPNGGPEAPTLLGVTAVIGIGGAINLHVAFSFQSELIDALCDRMTEGMPPSAESRHDLQQAVAGEIINTVVGHCTVDLQVLDRAGVPITPPAVVFGTKVLPRFDTAIFMTQSLATPLGRMDISLVGPGNLFTIDLERKQ
jgi:CheY-specific phosphatase CheX/signal transduction histidine kinase